MLLSDLFVTLECAWREGTHGYRSKATVSGGGGSGGGGVEGRAYLAPSFSFVFFFVFFPGLEWLGSRISAVPSPFSPRD